ncbi:MAG: glycosyltransferase family 4 protein [Planctomycetaceae bacterium]
MHLALAPVALPLVMRGAKLSVFLHGIEAWRRVRRGEGIALRRSRLLIANSEHTARGFKAANPEFAKREVIVCPLGSETAATQPPATESPSIGRSAEGTQSIALIVGRMSAEERYKGHDLLIELWPTIVNRVPDAMLVVVGDGDDRARLEAKAHASRASRQIQFRGRVSDEELRTLYRDCDFFVMPSRGEGFGLVFLEAMRAGKACLGGIGAASEVIEHGVTGYVVDPADAEAVGEAISRLFTNRDETERMGRAGAERFADQFTAGHFRSRLRDILETLEGRR